MKVPMEVLRAVLHECYLIGYDPVQKGLTHAKVRSLLSKVRYPQYFQNATQIIARLTQRQPVEPFSTEERDTLEYRFRQIKAIYDDLKGNRKSMLNYNYIIFKLCELEGYTRFFPFVQLFKSSDNLRAADKVWQDLCGVLHWEYRPTNFVAV